jgi:hypothetical protein
VLQQQRHPLGEALAGGLAEHEIEDPLLVGRPPVHGHGRGQPAIEQQPQPAIVRIEVGVVERLRIVGIGPRVQQQRRQLRRPRVRRLGDRTTLSETDRPRQRGEPAFGDGGVAARIRPPRQQQPGRLDRIAAPDDPAVTDVEQRSPAARPRGGGGPSRIAVQQRPQAVDVAGGRGRRHAGVQQPRGCGQHRLGLAPPIRRVVAQVGQAGEIDEVIGGRCRAAGRSCRVALHASDYTPRVVHRCAPVGAS